LGTGAHQRGADEAGGGARCGHDNERGAAGHCDGGNDGEYRYTDRNGGKKSAKGARMRDIMADCCRLGAASGDAVDRAAAEINAGGVYRIGEMVAYVEFLGKPGTAHAACHGCAEGD